ncbi:unnamed protein product [Rotaria magnacalcarata]|uniref:Gamma-glutamylcyclotransferase n=2 Tax=Rotaria magnacalcarata TaxID=392030 RepID=A0A819YBX2_9BILA|nr:unnamed protein product [Rotaria magnacalcarata]
MGLRPVPREYVMGSVLISSGDQIIPFIEAFIKRETSIMMPDRIDSIYALTCAVNKKSAFYFEQTLDLSEQAEKVARAYGFSGTNLQYLTKLVQMYCELKIDDSSTLKIEELYEKTFLHREHSSMDCSKWLDMCDRLKTPQERLNALNERTITMRKAEMAKYAIFRSNSSQLKLLLNCASLGESIRRIKYSDLRFREKNQ